MARTAFLSPDEVSELVQLAQTGRRTSETSDPDSTALRYGSLHEAEEAEVKLWQSFQPAVQKAASYANRLPREDAVSTAKIAFFTALRSFDPEAGRPFHAALPTILRRAVSDAERASSGIVVKDDAHERFNALMARHGKDAHAAYIECRDTKNGFTPETFLAIHRAVNNENSLEALTEEGAFSVSEEAAPSFEEVVDRREYAAFLLSTLPEEQERALRLFFGFEDSVTVNLCFCAGLRPGEVLDGGEVAAAMGGGLSTANKRRTAGLKAMRAEHDRLVELGL